MTACSDFPSDAILWIKEVEMVDSLDELKSSRSVSGKNFPNFEILDVEITSALNKIIQNPQIQEEDQSRGTEKRGPVSTRKTDRLVIYNYFRVTGAHDTSLDYVCLFSVTLHNDKIQEFDARWDEVPLCMSKIPSDEILESLYKLGIREPVQLKTVFEFYDMEIHQKISMTNYQKLKTMMKRSKDQKLRLRNFDVRHGKIETGTVVKNRNGLSDVERGKYMFTVKRKFHVRSETNAVSDMRVTIIHKNRHRMPPHLLSHQ